MRTVFLVLLAAAFAACAPAAGASAPLLGATCATVSPASQQACINAYVAKLKGFSASGCNGGPIQACVNSFADGLNGARCGMLQQQCIQSPPFPAGGCSAAYQACVNKFVIGLQKKGAPAGAQPSAAKRKAQPMVGTTCATVSPSSQQACINKFVTGMKGYSAASCNGAPLQTCVNTFADGLNGAQCGMDQQVCSQMGPPGQPAGGCGAAYQACINQFVIGLQKKAAAKSG